MIRYRNRGLTLILLGALGAMTAAAAEPAPSPSPSLDQGRALTEQFYQGQLDALHQRFSDEMKAELSLDKLKEAYRQVGEQLGAEAAVVDEQAQAKGDYVVYVRKARFAKQGEKTFELHWALRKDQKVAGFFVVPTEKATSGVTVTK